MSEGYFIGRGDKTSCGGEVLDGDDRVNMFGLLHAREGDRVSCGANGGIYRIVGGVSFIDSHGKLVAGTLDSFSDCPCRAKLIPSVFTASYRNESTRAMASNEPAQAASSSIAERTGTPSSIPSPAYRPLNAVSQLEPQEPGFYVVPQSTTREALEADLFPIRNAAVMSKFRALNPYVAEVKAGSMMVLSDPNNTTCSYQEAQLMQAANQVNSALEPLTSEEANFLFKHGAEIASFIGETSTWLGVSAVIMEKHLGNLRGTLQAIERLHQESYRRHGNLKSPQFLSERQQLLAKLDSHLLNSTRLRGQTSLGDHPKLKTALGISSRSLVHHWSKAGAPGQIPGYATHVDKMSRATRYMTAGGYIGIGLGSVSSLLAIQQVCNGESGLACRKIKFTEGGKFGGSTMAGVLGGEIAKSASGSICIALGVSTGIAGVACVVAIVGTGAWMGTTLGGIGGEFAGEQLYEATLP